MENAFGLPLIPDNEEQRLEKFHGVRVLGSYQEEGNFKHIASRTSRMFRVYEE